ncbi:MAG: glycine oxidase ThiO [Gammaproteobacteria bacterium]|nr:glycine oxidase ThiO [Gammaproteobacteria bacterium]
MNSVIIVGGGIIGLLSAYELDKSGVKVTLIDRQQFGQESSWAGGGIISPLYPWRYPDAVTRLAKLSQELYPALIQHMQQATGLDAEYLPSGMLVLGDYPNENPQAWAAKYDIQMQTVDAVEIQQLEPQINDQYQQGFWFPLVHQVRNPRLVALAKAFVQNTNITLIENQAVTDIISEAGKVTEIRTHESSYQADAYVVSCGAWTSSLLKQTGIDTGIKPIKGQMLLLKGPPGLVKHITLSEDRYIIPRKDGRILIGSTNEDCGFEKDTDPGVKKELLDYAIRTIPALNTLEIEHHWAGLRPGSTKGIPCIGEHPQLGNLFINSGHYRNGLVMAPASARLLSEIMLKKPRSLAEKDYALCDGNHNKN